jgi:hypothetical protein
MVYVTGIKKSVKKYSLLSPLLLTLSSISFLYSLSSTSVPPDQILIPLAFLEILLILMALLIHQLFRDWELSGICLSALVLVLFFSPQAFKPAAIIMTIVILVWLGLSFLIKWIRGKRFLALLLTFTSLTIVIIQIIFQVRIFTRSPLNVYMRSPMGGSKIDLSSTIKPDIYYIVLDGYARADVLKDFYSFDNSEFISYLKSKGFIIPDNAHSNYAKTALSIPSTLNMDYVQNFAPNLADNNFWWLMTPYIDHSQLSAALKQEGYETYAIASDWGITNNQTVDHYFKPYSLDLNDFEGLFLNTTPVGLLVKFLLSPFTSFPSYQAHRAFIENNFKALSEISKIGGSKFVFAHVISPHPPFVFDSEGNPLTPNYPFSFSDANDYAGTPEQYRNLYVGQVNYVNNQLEPVIDEILSNSAVPPVIILQADHGPGMLTDFSSAVNTCIRERFSIFAAYYLPGQDASVVPSDITPVNIFRIILNQYFHANLPLNENASYYFKDTNTIYNYLDVSSRIDEACTP